jgi:hypothetical protein
MEFTDPAYIVLDTLSPHMEFTDPVYIVLGH